MVKRVRKYGDVCMTHCFETCNRCFGRTVYEDLQTGDLGVIVNLATGEVLVDLDTFLDSRRFFDDVVRVVRCKDCKHCDPENYHCDHPMSTAIPLFRKPDDFCSYGERKEASE